MPNIRCPLSSLLKVYFIFCCLSFHVIRHCSHSPIYHTLVLAPQFSQHEHVYVIHCMHEGGRAQNIGSIEHKSERRRRSEILSVQTLNFEIGSSHTNMKFMLTATTTNAHGCETSFGKFADSITPML